MPQKTLLEALAEVPDPRADNKRHPLPAILALALGAVLGGARSLLAIAEWGRTHGPALAFALGFRHAKTPCVATLSNVFRALDARALERVLARYFGASELPAEPALGRWQPFAVDGKALRGTYGDDGTPGVALVAAYLHRHALVVDQERIESGDELGAVRRLLLTLPVEGRVLTGDSLQTQRDVCASLAEKGGPTRCPSRTINPA